MHTGSPRCWAFKVSTVGLRLDRRDGEQRAFFSADGARVRLQSRYVVALSRTTSKYAHQTVVRSASQ
jgi:hypothetical protein